MTQLLVRRRNQELAPESSLTPEKEVIPPSIVASLIIRGSINEESLFSFRRETETVLNKVAETGQKVIPIEICSVGGEIYPTLGIIDTIDSIRKAGLGVITYTTGFAFSAGACLLAMGDKGWRFASPYSTIMMHDSSSGFFGKTSDQEIELKEVKRLRKLLYSMIEAHCGIEKGSIMKELLKFGNKDWYLTPKEAKKFLIIDEIGIPRISCHLKQELQFSLDIL